ncbi:hypothetical protein DYB26_004137 [Aphanomyces astaci]|uniref:Uncharacterized protein n=1 Tax=Aphanomyces astaci TaxID=112090 RepID=A0A418ESN5_APHAT|nr:hypothetical protein DYB26_004137 [Aphanomyces astaci]
MVKSLLPTATQVEFMQVDLMDLSSVHAFVEAFRQRHLPLHMLINNAGVMAPPFSLSVDGIESQFATNHVGHHALTIGLLPVLEASAPSRVVMVSSRAHVRAPGIDFANMNNPHSYFSWNWYSQSKLANILFARELSRQLEVRNVMNVYINVVHPGVVRTSTTTSHQHWLATLVMSMFELAIDDGAKTQLYVATSDDIVTHNWHGEYFVPIARLGTCDTLGHNARYPKISFEATRSRDSTHGVANLLLLAEGSTLLTVLTVTFYVIVGLAVLVVLVGISFCWLNKRADAAFDGTYAAMDHRKLISRNGSKVSSHRHPSSLTSITSATDKRLQVNPIKKTPSKPLPARVKAAASPQPPTTTQL